VGRSDRAPPVDGALREYGEAWIRERPRLRPKTIVLYEGLWRLHICPSLGNLALAEISTPRLRKWRRDLLDAGVGPVTVAKAYRLLRSVLNTAVADRLIARYPCQIPDAGQEKSPERPTATIEQVFTVARKVPERYRLLVLLACFNSLRWGELAGLARQHVDTADGTILVERLSSSCPPASWSSARPSQRRASESSPCQGCSCPTWSSTWLASPARATRRSCSLGPRAGRCVDRPSKTIGGGQRRRRISPTCTFHDLRHTGNTYAAETGATLRDLMDRMGHSTTRATLIYLHKTSGRDRKIADALSKLVEDSRRERKEGDGGTDVHEEPKGQVGGTLDE
jgi:integrase